jgi:hypothetical protein
VAESHAGSGELLTRLRSEALAPPAPFARTPHLVGLVGETERLAAILAATEPEPATRERLEAEAAVATLVLDGSPLRAPPAGTAIAAHPAIDPATTPARSGSWLDAFRVGEATDESILALEYARTRRALAADDLAAPLLRDLRGTLEELHRRLTETLVADDVRARLRRTQQAVHDASVGQMVFRAPDPDVIEGRLGALEGWLTTSGAREHGLLVSGVLHVELLALHPFEAANGRLARTAARLILRARGLDPHRLALAEPVLATDPLGYHREVPATQRRREATIWLERWGEAVTGGLRLAARALGLLEPQVRGRAEGFLRERTEPDFTVVDYRGAVGIGPEESRDDLGALLDAGRIRRVAGARGLRFEIATGPEA